MVDNVTILTWMEEIASDFKQSRWSPVLDVPALDLWEALRSSLYLGLLRLARQPKVDTSDQGMSAPRSPRIPVFFRDRGWSVLVRSWLDERRACGISAPPQQTEIVFWPREPTHIKAQVPVSQSLDEMGIPYRFVACQPKIVHTLQSLSTPVVFTHAAWGKVLKSVHQEAVQRLSCLNDEPGVTLPDFPAQVERGKLINTLRKVFYCQIPLIMETAAACHAMFDQIKPDVIVVGNDLTTEGRVAALQARKHGVVTVSLMHGTIFGDPIRQHHVVDKILVYGEAAQNILISQGLSADRIEIVGAPYLDKLPQQTHRIHPSIQAHLGANSNLPLVLIATSGPGHSVSHVHHRMIIQHLMQLSCKLPDVLFVVKLHRKDRLEYYRQEQFAIPNSRLLLFADNTPGLPQNIFDWLQGCRLLLTTASTVAIEAMLMHIPVITMDFVGELPPVDFIDAGATVHVYTAAMLEAAVLTILGTLDNLIEVQQRATTFLNRSFFRLDGKSSYRGAALLSSLKDRSGS